MKHLIEGLIEIDDVTDVLAPKFASMFTSLLNVMAVRETKQRARQQNPARASQTSSVPVSSTSTVRKRPADSQASSIEPKRARTGNTPDRPPNPVNPDFSHGTDKSGNSVEFKDEEHTKKMISLMLMNTMSVLGGDFRKLQWLESGVRPELYQSSISHS
jgi:hypothetical protein